MGGTVSLTERASAIISSAQGYQAQASDPRLNKPSTARGVEGGLNKLKNLSKAQTVVAERKAKREEANLVGTGIKVGATLWKIPEQGKMTKVGLLAYKSYQFNPGDSVVSRLSPSESFTSLAQKLRRKMHSGHCWAWSGNHLWIGILMPIC